MKYVDESDDQLPKDPEFHICGSCGAGVPVFAKECPKCGGRVIRTAADDALAKRASVPVQEPTPRLSASRSVTITGVDIPLGEMVWLILKFSVASIPVALLWAFVIWMFSTN